MELDAFNAELIELGLSGPMGEIPLPDGSFVLVYKYKRAICRSSKTTGSANSKSPDRSGLNSHCPLFANGRFWVCKWPVPASTGRIERNYLILLTRVNGRSLSSSGFLADSVRPDTTARADRRLAECTPLPSASYRTDKDGNVPTANSPCRAIQDRRSSRKPN